MPYTLNNIPPAYRSLPKSVQTMWVSTWNNVYMRAREKGDNVSDAESQAFAVANGMLKKRGYVKKGDRWVRRGEEELEGLSLDTPDDVVLAADALSLVGLHARLHKLYKSAGENKTKIVSKHDVVRQAMANRGIFHNVVDDLDREDGVGQD